MAWLTIAMLVPLAGALVIVALPADTKRWAKQVALGVSLVVLLLAVAMMAQFDVTRAGEQQFVEFHPWMPQLGVSYALGVNGIGLSMIVLSAVLVPLAILAAWHDHADNPRAAWQMFAWILVTQAMMIGVFAARDVFLFYLLFEAILVPMYFLIGLSGGAGARAAAMKFLLFGLAGGLIMLVAVIAVVFQTRDPMTGAIAANAYLTDSLTGLTFTSPAAEKWLFVAFFIAFAVKAPMWPVHTWLPQAAGEAPPAMSVLLVGVLDKIGTFGMITLCLPLFPSASRWAAPAVCALAVVSVLYGALVAIAQRDLRRLIAFTSISHFGFIVLGIFAMTSTGQSGSVLYMVNHGFSTGALFFVCGMLMARFGTDRIGEYGGIQRVVPLLSGVFLIAGLSSLALPGLSTFVSEFLVIVGTFVRYPVAAVLATTAIVLASLYILLTYQRMATGPIRPGMEEAPDLSGREKLVLAPVIAVIIALGFFPKPVLDVINPAVDTTMRTVGVTDPGSVLEGVDR